MRNLIRMLTVGAILLLGAAPAAHARAVIGISDNKPDMFGDPRFAALNVSWVRLVAPWDGLRRADERGRLDAWMSGARAHGSRVLLTFEKSRHGRRNPSARQLSRELTAFLRRYPGQIKAVVTWNEPNVNVKSKPPRRVAQWYRALRSVLRRSRTGAKLLAADVVDRDNVTSWMRDYLRELRRQRVPRPRYWGLHNYVDVNTLSYRRTRRFISAARGQVWLTETGGVVSRSNGSRIRFRGTGPTFQARATRYLLSTVLRRNPRIRYVFIYNWNAERPSSRVNWDSGLIDHLGNARPAFDVVRRYVRTGRP